MSRKLVTIFAILLTPFILASCSTTSKDSSGEVSSAVTRVEDKVGTKVYFAYDSARLTHKARKALKKDVVKELKNSKAKILIEGHCDERGTNKYNLALGKARANAVKKFLVRKGIKSSRIKTVSYGELRPVDTGHNEESWAKNRRAVTITLKK